MITEVLLVTLHSKSKAQCPSYFSHIWLLLPHLERGQLLLWCPQRMILWVTFQKQDKNVFLGMYLYLNQLLFLLKACSINLFSADTGRRHLDTTIIYHMDPNGGKPNRVRADAEVFKFNRLVGQSFWCRLIDWSVL